MLGPAFVASVAYIDPGNFAANFQGGARYGYLLLWAVVLASLVAVLVQHLSAKLGIVTGHSLPELVRAHFPPWATWGMWAQAELMAMATDVAEFLGAAIGLNLLFGMALLPAGLITGVVAFAVLGLQRRGYRRFELAIMAMLAVVVVCFLYETLRTGPSVTGSLRGLVPGLAGTESVYLAVAIVGATVMPHVVYLHSAMTSRRVACRDDRERSRAIGLSRLDVIAALGLAGLVNIAMLAVAARLFHTPALSGLATLSQAHAAIARLAGGTAALAFAIALLAAGASSSSVGTYAGQVIMAGFTGRRVPLSVRRGMTMAPALVILAAGTSPTSALLLSQVVLSFGIPFALIPLAVLTGRRDIMGGHRNHPVTAALAWACALAISGLDVFLLVSQFFLNLTRPFLAGSSDA
jgi:manganese transport protein